MKTKEQLLHMVVTLPVSLLVEILDNQQQLIDLHEKLKAKQETYIKLQKAELDKATVLVDYYKGLLNA